MSGLREIIAAAWAQERERYVIVDGRLWYVGPDVATAQSMDLLAAGMSPIAHLDTLCAAAVERALAEAGYVIVPRESSR